MKGKPIKIGTQTEIPKELITDQVRLVSDLTFESGARSGPAFYCLAEELRESYLLPRAIDATPYLPHSHLCSIEAEPLEREYWWPPIGMTEEPLPPLGPNPHIRYDQAPAWEAISRPPEWPWGRILALGCGKGKTFLGLRLACLRDTRTLVVCHTVDMMRTWAKLAEELFKIAPEDMGFIGGGKMNWEDKKLVFSTMPGLLCREYPEHFYTDFGLVLLDEGDLLGAEKLSNILPLFLGERLMLTATPERRDGCEFLYAAHVGPICYRDVTPDLEPLCYVMDSPVPAVYRGEKMEGFCWSRFTKRMEPHIPRTVNKLADYQPRKDWAIDLVMQLLRQGRKILFVGERVEELKYFNERLKGMSENFKSGLALGNRHMKGQNLDEILDSCDCVWGIQQIAKRGLNEPAFDTLIIQYATFNEPGRLRQINGRVLRFKEGKNDPLVVLLNDAEISCMDNNAQKIFRQLQGEGYTAEWFNHG